MSFIVLHYFVLSAGVVNLANDVNNAYNIYYGDQHLLRHRYYGVHYYYYL